MANAFGIGKSTSSRIIQRVTQAISNLMSKVVYKYTCGRCSSSYYDETDGHLRVRAGEHIEHIDFQKM